MEQKRCAKCGQPYDADFDGCPRCAKAEQYEKAGEGLHNLGSGMQACGCLLTMLITVPIVLFMLFGLGGC